MNTIKLFRTFLIVCVLSLFSFSTAYAKVSYIKNKKTINIYKKASVKSKRVKLLKPHKKRIIKITKIIKKGKYTWLKSKYGYIKKTKNIVFVKSKKNKKTKNMPNTKKQSAISNNKLNLKQEPSSMDILKGEFYFSHKGGFSLLKYQKKQAKKLGIDTNKNKYYGNCIACHSTSKSNDLTTLAIKFNRQYNIEHNYNGDILFDHIKNPKKYNKNSKMPYYYKVLSNQEIAYIVYFIQSLKQ